VLVIGLLGWGSLVLAGGDHAHGKGPHGGEVATFGAEYHIEVVKEGKMLVFYVLDENSSPVAIKDVSGGTITVIAPGKGQNKIEIQKNNELKQFSAPSPEAGKVTVVVKLSSQGKDRLAKFNLAL
jgi:hypothetical protein